MTEEEKKAIDSFKYYINAIDTFGTIDKNCCNNLYEPAQVVIDLVEKLQKENEELRAITNGYNSLKKDSEAFVGIPLIIADGKYFNEGILTENYVPKDKIKKKIEELNNYYKKEVYPIRYQWGDIDITEFYDRQIDLLEDLLK